MASRGWFLRTTPPFRFLADHLVTDEDFVRDAQVLLELDDTTVDGLATYLAASEGFLGRAELSHAVKQVLQDEESSRRVVSILVALGGVLHQADIPVAEAMDLLEASIGAKAKLDASGRSHLAARIRRLVAEPVGIARHYKAVGLVSVLGSELQESRVICDVRPIFDERRERIEGVLSLTTLRLDYLDLSGNPGAIEVQLSESQVGELQGQLANAKNKHVAIKELAQRQDLAVPNSASETTRRNLP